MAFWVVIVLITGTTLALYTRGINKMLFSKIFFKRIFCKKIFYRF